MNGRQMFEGIKKKIKGNTESRWIELGNYLMRRYFLFDWRMRN
jgi:hypothetical protein